jgi:hypothetical protein
VSCSDHRSEIAARLYGLPPFADATNGSLEPKKPRSASVSPWPAQLAVNCPPVRLRPPCRHRCYCRRSRVDTRFRTLVGDALPQRPGNAGSTCTLQASTTVVAPIERLAATFGSISQTPSAAERHGFCAWIVSVEACPLPSKGASYARFGITQRTLATPVHRLIVTSERVIGINRNDCSPSIETTARHQPVRASLRPSGRGQLRPARRARRMQSPAAVGLIDKLAAICRFDSPPARSLSTSRILRMGNLAPGMP